VLTRSLDRFLTIAGLRHDLVAGFVEHLGEVEPDERFVLGDQDARAPLGSTHGSDRRMSLWHVERIECGVRTPDVPEVCAVTQLRPEIQGLRMVAVVAVIADHLMRWPRGGFVGVDVFFVISGYLITGLLLREFETRGSISFTGFYARRIKRIMPAGVFVLVATTAASYVLLAGSRFASLRIDALASLLFVANWRFGAANVDYFQHSLPPSPVQHFWSLAIEEQFYFFWPWLMLGLLVFGMRNRLWAREHARLVSGGAISVVSALSLAWAFHDSANNPAFAYFSTFSRTWELGVGALVAVVAPRLERPLNWMPRAGLAGILASFALVRPGHGFPAPWALLPVLSTAAVLVSSASGSRQPWLLTNRASRFLGDISYSLYLWHFPVVILLLTLIPGGTPLYWVAGSLITLAFSVTSYTYLEQPARRSEWFRRTDGSLRGLSRGWLAFSVACTAIVVGAVGIAHVVNPRRDDNGFPVQRHHPSVVSFDRTQANPSDCFGAAALDPTHHCRSLNPRHWLAQDPGRVAKDSGGSYGCYSYAGKPAKICTYGPTKHDPLRVAVTGDSHAAVLASSLKLQLDKANWRMTTFVGNGCVLGRPHTPCSTGLPTIRSALREGRFDLVIVTWRLNGDRSVNPDTVSQLRDVAATGAKVVFVEDNPTIDQPLLDCVSRVGFTPRSTCQVSEKRAYARPNTLRKAAADLPGSAYVRTRDLYCLNGECPGMIGNVFVYLDNGSHITGTYLKTTSPYLAKRIMTAAGLPRK